MQYEFYIDVYVFTNFFFDYLALLLLREVRNKKCRLRCMLLVSAVGVSCSTICMLILKNSVMYELIVHLLINPAMFYGCFRQKNFREFILDYTVGYLLMMLIGGCVQWLCQVLGQPQIFGVVMAAVAVIMSVFLILFKGKEQEEKIYDIKICQGERELSTKGFFDTGNLLTDPYVKLPVSLIAKEALIPLMGVEDLSYRYIPFVSLGKEHGMIQAVTLDRLSVRKKKEELFIEPAVFAIVEEQFLKGNEYQVILNGRLW